MRVLLALLLLGLALTATASARAPARLTATFGTDARLGEPTSLRLRLAISPQLPTPLARLRVLYPRGLDLVTSGLALDTCRRDPRDFSIVAIDATGLARCPRNAVIATGTASGEIRLDTLIIRQTAAMTLLAGPLHDGQLDLVGLVEGINPFGVMLVYDGALQPANKPYGGAITINLPEIPDLPYDDARAALLAVDATIGAPTIRYTETRHGQRRTYHPDGIGLPATCPRAGMRFLAQLTFEDHTTVTTATRVPCPPPRRVTRR